ncbi:MAG: 2-C-methyl-D-erythritol 2,4-cyclodiphosphate synthase [Candidatus Coatesbacteria bacterium]|nr:2-C-methyl-D-erythritol 2,4-cyclodiphosphate synthase [Candidatus Coatesbacteria bacterium]
MHKLYFGYGFDTHRKKEGNGIHLGGVFIQCDYSVEAHSDGDVLCHAIIDAILSATGQEDIGTLFSDTDPQYKNARSLEMLRKVWNGLVNQFIIEKIDFTIVMDYPILKDYSDKIKNELMTVFGKIEKSKISIKGKRTEGVAFIGGITALGMVVLCRQ